MEHLITTKKTKNTVIENADSFFESKEHYLRFRAEWKQYIADGKHRCEAYKDSQGGTCKRGSSLTSLHHLIYNGLRNRDLSKSFSEKSLKENKAWLSNSIRFGRGDWIFDPFGDTVNLDMLERLSKQLNS